MADPRAKSTHYSKAGRVKFDDNEFDFLSTQFVIDDNYVGEPPHVQVSIDNLNDNIDENFLRKELAKLGKIRILEIVRHPKTGQHLGMAKVQFEEIQVASACVDTFNGKHLMGKELRVFKDVRFAEIEMMKEEKLNPLKRPPPLPQPPLALSSTTQSSLISSSLPTNVAAQPQPPPPHIPNFPNSALSASSHTPITPATPLSLHTPPTPASAATSLGTEPNAGSRGRLDDRIAKLMNQPFSMLSTIVAPIARSYHNTSGGPSPINGPTSSSGTPTTLPGSPGLSSAHQSLAQSVGIARGLYTSSNLQLKYDKNTVTPHHSHHHHQQNHNHSGSHQNHNSNRSAADDHNQQQSDEEWNKLPEKPPDQPLSITLSELQIQKEVLPYGYPHFFETMMRNLHQTTFKKLREQYGFQCLDKAQQSYFENRNKQKVQQDLERLKRERMQLEKRFMSRNNQQKPTEAPRPRANLVRSRTTVDYTGPSKNDANLVQDNRRPIDNDISLRRVNRSSAYVPELERRGSHNTDLDSDSSDSDTSDSESVSSSSSSGSSSSFSSSGSSRSSSSSSSASSIGSYSRSSRSSFDGAASIHKKSASDHHRPDKSKAQNEVADSKSGLADLRPEPISELDIASALLSLRSDAVSAQSPPEDEDLPGRKKQAKTTLTEVKKRRKRGNDLAAIGGFATEFRAAKKFASGAGNLFSASDENDENAMFDENLIDARPEARFIFPPRTKEEKQRLLDDLIGTLSEEDIKYLAQVHEREGYNRNHEVQIPFGSEATNKAHLSMRKHMIDGKLAEGHPKWWRGCSRCDVVEVSEKQKPDIDELDFEDLKKAPIKSHVIQTVAGSSSRRDQRGDQRRFAVLNADIDPELLKKYTTSTLQMRAKNLRFSRSKIHKWGLFACQNIANGDVVVEYVGEKIRPSLADHREKLVYTNLPTHDGSSYFFRVDCDVIDATLKGNKARFINHSCNPNCIAKVIKHDNGQNSIVIYAKQNINVDEEITYDYKFPREETDQKIRCNCRAPNCQKYLN